MRDRDRKKVIAELRRKVAGKQMTFVLSQDEAIALLEEIDTLTLKTTSLRELAAKAQDDLYHAQNRLDAWDEGRGGRT